MNICNPGQGRVVLPFVVWYGLEVDWSLVANMVFSIISGEHYWKLTEDGVASGYPRLISRAWPGLPGNIDAAFTYKNGKTYFFKGSKYWRYNGQKMDGDYPKEISEGM